MNAGRTNVPGAQIGDIIVYDWDGESSTKNLDGLDHAAFITAFAANNSKYPQVSEWSANGSKASTYVDRGWTWSQISGMWLQEKTHHHVQAFLLHVDAG
jgi:hypothetical protein